MKHFFSLLSFLLIATNTFAAESSFRKLVCTPSKEDAIIEVLFPREVYASRPFIGFAEIWAKVTVEHRKLPKTYVRDRVLFIPETHPPGPDMRGQSSDAVYIQLHPEFIAGNFNGTYYGQLFINDKDAEFRGTYFRYMNSEIGPGIVCHPGQ